MMDRARIVASVAGSLRLEGLEPSDQARELAEAWVREQASDEELREAEADLTYWRALRLAAFPLPGRYDLDHLRAFHRALFADLYAWAGELRTIVITKPGSLFALPQHIETSARNVSPRSRASDTSPD